jgi:hypothetical protein
MTEPDFSPPGQAREDKKETEKWEKDRRTDQNDEDEKITIEWEEGKDRD